MPRESESAETRGHLSPPAASRRSACSPDAIDLHDIVVVKVGPPRLIEIGQRHLDLGDVLAFVNALIRFCPIMTTSAGNPGTNGLGPDDTP